MDSDGRSIFPERKWARLLRDSEVSSKAKLLGLLLATWADHKTGEMYVSIPTLRAFFLNDKEVPVVERTIIRWRNELVAAGFFKRVTKGNGRGRASVYRLTFPGARNGDTEDAETVTQTVTLPPSETLTSNVTPSAGEVQVDQDQQLAAVGTSREKELEDLVGSLEQKLGQTVNGNPTLREALLENGPGVLRCAEKAKTGRSPVGLLLKMVRDGDHLAPEIRYCNGCAREKSNVRDIGPELRARQPENAPPGEYLLCGDCANTSFGLPT